MDYAYVETRLIFAWMSLFLKGVSGGEAGCVAKKQKEHGRLTGQPLKRDLPYYLREQFCFEWHLIFH